MDDLRDRIAKALGLKQKSNDSRPSVRAADAVMAVLAEAGHADDCVHPDQHAAVIREWEDAEAELERLRAEARTLAHTLKLAAAERDALQAATDRVRAYCEDERQWYHPSEFPGIPLVNADEVLAALDHPTDTTETWPPQVGDLWEASDGSRWFATDISLSIGDPEGPDRILLINGGRAQMEPDELLTANPHLISRRRPLDDPDTTGETETR